VVEENFEALKTVQLWFHNLLKLIYWKIWKIAV